MTLTVGSLFSGIGGLDLGLEAVGFQILWQVEKDLYARKVLRRHWPRARLWDDVTQVGAAHLAPVDIVCGGFPCQDISPANPNGKGLDGARSGLWSHFARIVGELRPRFVLIENNGQNRKRWLPRVLGDLAALGFDAEWHCIPASHVGAPHERDRCFVVAYANGLRQLQRQGLEPELGRRPRDGGPPSRGFVASATGEGRATPRTERPGEEAGAGSQRQLAGPGWWAAEPRVGRMAHGVPARMDRLRCLGNAVVPQVAHILGQRIAALAAQPQGVRS